MKKLLIPLLAALSIAACATTGAPSGATAPMAYPGAEPARDAAGKGEGVVMADGAAAAPGSVPVPAALEPGRQMILTASVSLRARDPWATADRVQAIATGLQGDVIGLSQSGSGDQRHANLVLRVPSDRFNDAQRQLRGLSDVEVLSSSVDGKDVTEQFVDLEARLKVKQAEETRFLTLLAQARTIDEILRVEQALSSVRTQIEQMTGQLNSLKNRTQFSTITVSVAPLTAVVTEPGVYDPARTVERALATLVTLLRVGVDLAIWLLVFGWIPLILFGAIALAQRARTRAIPT